LEIVVVEKRIEDFREWQTLIFLEVDYIVKWLLFFMKFFK
jgi:hypothetical protein